MYMRRDPWTAFDNMRREMNHWLERSGRTCRRRARSFPALNIWEDGECLYAEAEVPGLKLSDLEIYVEANELILKGRRAGLQEDELVYHRRERGEGEFSRTVMLPLQVNSEKVEATLKNGVLCVTLPKAEVSKARRIQVTSN